MKRYIFCIVVLFVNFHLQSFSQITHKYNSIRIGDEIIKQQVEYTDPGDAGGNIVWDFSRLKTINEEYKLVYSLPPLQDDSIYIMGDHRFAKKNIQEGELIVATEHNTMYYYRQKEDSLLLLGHENPTVRLCYTDPVFIMNYPANYGQSNKGKNYISGGVYSSTVFFNNHGNSEILVDAFGKMILPTGDTINPVIRIKHVKSFVDDNNEIDKVLETYSWYTKGYRYPVFEAIKNYYAKDSAEIFSTAFLYPPQEHFYITTDTDNLALLDEMWDMDNKDILEEQDQKPSEPLFIFNRIYPNPVSSQLTLDYTLSEKSSLIITIVSTNGNIVKKINKSPQEAGDYQEIINLSGLSSGTYHLNITDGVYSPSWTIIKK